MNVYDIFFVINRHPDKIETSSLCITRKYKADECPYSERYTLNDITHDERYENLIVLLRRNEYFARQKKGNA